MPIERDQSRAWSAPAGRSSQGSELQDFKVHILGVLQNVQGPKRNLILARLEGGPLAETGVAAGMSGSPVYIDGRLIGAVSYSIGAFPKEAIAGITPIAEMKDATAMARRRAGTAGAHRTAGHARRADRGAQLPPTRGSRRSPNRPADVQVFGLPAAAGAQMGAMLRPIATPLVMSGFEPGAAGHAGCRVPRRRLHAGGRRRSGGQGGDELKSLTGPLREGDAIGVSLVGGDLEMGATGTITHIDGDRVYAFGHPFFNLGPSQFPMTRAYVYTMLPSLMSSFKISTMGEVIGTMQQDRATAIAGTLGKGPAVIPMTVTLELQRAKMGAPRSARSRITIANDQLFTPLLTYVALVNTLGAYERQFGARDVLGQEPGAASRATATCGSKTSSPATTRRSAPPRPWPGRSRCCSPTTVEPVTVERARRVD